MNWKDEIIKQTEGEELAPIFKNDKRETIMKSAKTFIELKKDFKTAKLELIKNYPTEAFYSLVKTQQQHNSFVGLKNMCLEGIRIYTTEAATKATKQALETMVEQNII